MGYRIRRADFYLVTVKDRPGEAYNLLSQLSDLGVNLLAITLIPVGPMSTQVTVFPEDAERLKHAARNAKLTLAGPEHALLVEGEDALGSLAGIHERLAAARVNVSSGTGISDGRGRYSYILHVKPEDFDRAAKALEV